MQGQYRCAGGNGTSSEFTAHSTQELCRGQTDFRSTAYPAYWVRSMCSLLLPNKSSAVTTSIEAARRECHTLRNLADAQREYERTPRNANADQRVRVHCLPGGHTELIETFLTVSQTS